MNPRYPIYIPSKSRFYDRYYSTWKALDKIKVPYSIVVEPQEYDSYAACCDINKLLVLPENNINLIGSRNWILEHSKKLGFERHWQLDDNICAFYRLNNNKRNYVGDGTIFRVAEDFVDRYENVVLSGFNYMGFAKGSDKIPPFILNTRIYSCTLVKNDIKHRWRSIYNDDTDISLNVLKDGDCTILFNAFLCEKSATMRMRGGNTDELYLIEEGRKKMAEALVKLHPDVTTITHKFNRYQHHVNYKPFKKNKLILKKEAVIKKGIDNYGMVLKQV